MHRRGRVDRFGCRARGFTLVELVIVMAVVAILAAALVPAYRDQVLRGHRAAAQAVLTELAGRQHQYRADARTYAQSSVQLRATIPASVAERYDVEVLAPAGAVPPTFLVRATPRTAQAADACGTLAIDEAGNRTPAACW